VGIEMGAPWPDDLCANCPYADMCNLTDTSEEPNGCRRVDEWREGLESRMDAERGK
jgi:hypothetical protein